MSEVLKMNLTNLTKEELDALKAIADFALENMGGKEPQDLFEDNFSFFNHFDLTKKMENSNTQEVADIISTLKDKGLIIQDNNNSSPLEWALTKDGIRLAQENFEINVKEPSEPEFIDDFKLIDDFKNSLAQRIVEEMDLDALISYAEDQQYDFLSRLKKYELFSLAIDYEAEFDNYLKSLSEDKQKEILKFSSSAGLTIAHELAGMKNYKFTDPGILKLADKDGWTVAHTMAYKGYEFTCPEILKLVDSEGVTVADVCDDIFEIDKFNKILQESETENSPGMG